MSVNVRFVNYNKYTILVQDVAGKEVVHGDRRYTGALYFLLNFSVNLIIMIIIK